MTAPCKTCAAPAEQLEQAMIQQTNYYACSNPGCYFYRRYMPQAIWEQRPDNKHFAVIAGRYEEYCAQPGEMTGENVQFCTDQLTLDQAIATAMEHNTRPFCYIVYKGVRLTVEPDPLQEP